MTILLLRALFLTLLGKQGIKIFESLSSNIIKLEAVVDPPKPDKICKVGPRPGAKRTPAGGFQTDKNYPKGKIADAGSFGIIQGPTTSRLYDSPKAQ
ncbi:hypothetical protein P691DRAFT_765916 [Macrolepiota fuliginosa MF-IS2]|uniref:Uncharacterized protein n=1 Tax=Macrolepiota fuliginosa MF-IS2 TaxID=1400762 RepID=A0A9P5WZJ4_9AGAR|nr:hypothetical protein P691DRAFT_765916 [Macrolepiota fuliginosa MF-IS2]